MSVFIFLKMFWHSWHPSYYLKSTLQSFRKKILQMGNALKKCKVNLKDAKNSSFPFTIVNISNKGFFNLGINRGFLITFQTGC